MAEFLFEIFSEEIPARMQRAAADQLKQLAEDSFRKEGVSVDAIETFVTPRRLTVVARGLASQTPVRIEERKGPRVDAPKEALEGFLTSCHVTLDACEKQESPKGTFWITKKTVGGVETATLLPSLMHQWLTQFSWPKSMRWDGPNQTWVRPIRSLLCVMDGQVVPFTYNGLASGNTTLGHRFLSDGVLSIHDFADYKTKLAGAFVILDWHERRALIAKKLQEAADQLSLTLIPDPALLDEVVGLVEWPEVFAGTIDASFMDLPREVLITPMRVHQRYFALEDGKGNLANAFLVVANTKPDDGGKALIAGNQRVLRARLGDATFYWDLDQKITLKDHAATLHRLTFYKGLGTIADKVVRLGALAPCFDVNRDDYKEAAALCKADLVTGLVAEFPEVQGVMGRYYARIFGAKADVADAIEQHYWPKGGQGVIPQTSLGVALAIADRLDTLMGFFALGIQPTGSKDPLALRRAALGIIHLIVQSDTLVSLKDLMDHAWKNYEQSGYAGLKDPRSLVRAFILDRFKYVMRDQSNISYDQVEAVLSTITTEVDVDLRDLCARVKVLAAFLASSDGENLMASYKRGVNIVKAEEKKDKIIYGGRVEEGQLIEGAEVGLYAAATRLSVLLKVALEERSYHKAMALLASLRPAMDHFFETTRVNVDDASVRTNRLNLLAYCRTLLDSVSNFSKLEG